MHKPSVIIIGPAHPLRGGLASFNERLAQQFITEGHATSIYTFSLQYPKFLFPGTTQYSTSHAPINLHIKVCINSINPFNWIKVGLQLKKLQPNIIIVRYWLPFMGPCLGTILQIAKKNKVTKVVCIADNIIPHERRIGDVLFTKYFVPTADAFVTMSQKVAEDVTLYSRKKVITVVHPLYDNFGEAVPKSQAQQALQLDSSKKTLLFFGFIRHYKGLDILYKALSIIKQLQPNFYNNLQVLIAGEYYEKADFYNNLIQQLGIQNILHLHTNYIPDTEVRNYFCAADVVVQPYRNATQSGVTPLAYHYNLPMIVTNVGALAANVPHGKVGLVCAPSADAIAHTIVEFYNNDANVFIQNIKNEKIKYSWQTLTSTILELTSNIA